MGFPDCTQLPDPSKRKPVPSEVKSRPDSTQAPIPLHTKSYRDSTQAPIPLHTISYRDSTQAPIPLHTISYRDSTQAPIPLDTLSYGDSTQGPISAESKEAVEFRGEAKIAYEPPPTVYEYAANNSLELDGEAPPPYTLEGDSLEDHSTSLPDNTAVNSKYVLVSSFVLDVN